MITITITGKQPVAQSLPAGNYAFYVANVESERFGVFYDNAGTQPLLAEEDGRIYANLQTQTTLYFKYLNADTQESVLKVFANTNQSQAASAGGGGGSGGSITISNIAGTNLNNTFTGSNTFQGDTIIPKVQAIASNNAKAVNVESLLEALASQVLFLTETPTTSNVPANQFRLVKYP